MFCGKCSKENPDESKFCIECGEPMNNSSTNNMPSPNNGNNPNQRPAQWKSEGTTLILTIVLGLFGLGGIGHIYLGNITRGIVILIVGIILLIVSAVTFGIGLVVLIPFAIWVVYDARKQCKHYNDHLEQTGKPPW
jgi:TM2 domain-containing membrane protein YozV